MKSFSTGMVSDQCSKLKCSANTPGCIKKTEIPVRKYKSLTIVSALPDDTCGNYIELVQ